MSKKKKRPIVVCWECKKSFRGEAACQDHAQAKRHKWRPDTEPQVASMGTSSTQARTSAITPAWLPCSMCTMRFEDLKALSWHRKLHHGFSSPFATLVPQDSVPISPHNTSCRACKLMCEDEASLRWHLSLKHTCKVCMVHHESAQALEEHCHTSVAHKLRVTASEAAQGPVASSNTPGASKPACEHGEIVEGTVDLKDAESCARFVERYAEEGSTPSSSKDPSASFQSLPPPHRTKWAEWVTTT
ncbi:hypothetical protein PYCCODRAFT_334678 [Trametes coccinea BRFM310]|uniref:C2H2-type domain-containing protein n=1 Tax=Trametes coccinea (strain BRFM310) TaxID=1353009 RepID=A0A1Y2IR46_TRAC3|nr:hypothetical protein PYCCODRAFT_334678 [Trametes coccinea BRFM310]